jgi:hypothetical protein
MTNQVYTQSDFARRIGKSRQWVSNKILRHKKRWDQEWRDHAMDFTSVDGKEMIVKLVKSEGSRKWLMNIVSMRG